MNLGAAVLLSILAFFVGVAVTCALIAGMFKVADWIEHEWKS